MKVMELLPTEVGEAVETDDAIIITLPKENRMIMVMKKDIQPQQIKMNVQSVVEKTDKKQQASMEQAVVKKKKKTSKKDRTLMKYLPIIEDTKRGKSLNSSLALTIYKHYGIRLWKKITDDVMTRINSETNNKVDLQWMKTMLSETLGNYGMKLTMHQLYAHVMFLKGVGLIETKRKGQRGKIVYKILRKPEIPPTV